MGLPCHHEVWEKQKTPGFLLLSDIDPHWWYDRGIVTPQEARKILLDPLVVKGKGRPKGSKGKKKGDGEGSIRRDPSLFEYAAITLPSALDPPSSTAPPQLQTTIQNHSVTNPVFTESAVQRIVGSHPNVPATAIAVLWGARSRWDINDDMEPGISTTTLAILRGAGQDDDPYEAGTIRERAYMRSLNPARLIQANIELLDDEDALDV
jgi:hypothetical protein